MAFNFNKVIIGGRLTRDPELKTTPSGVSVANFSVAVNRPFKKGEKGEADFFECVAWQKTAEFITRNFFKGNTICVTGHLQQRSWERDGVKRTVTEVVADEACFVDAKHETSTERGGDSAQYVPDAYRSAPAQTPPPVVPKFEELSSSDELPF